jgi:undecaprenyl pyrophosphate phosphatase UppP
VTGYFAIHVLLDLVKKGRLVWFSYYTWAAGALVVILHLV